MKKKTRLPTLDEINELVSFLPRLYAEGFSPIVRWEGGNKDQDGVITLPWPIYDEVVDEFVKVASSGYWMDYDYKPEEAYQMFINDDVIKSAGLAEIKTMLTYFVRGERFFDGHWGGMIEGGYIRRLLQRLAELGTQTA